MADYKELFGKMADRVRETAGGSVLDVYARGADRAKAFGQTAKLTVALNRDCEELRRVYAEIGKLYYEQAKAAPEGFFAPLFEQADRLDASIRATRAEIDALKSSFSPAADGDIEVEIGDFDDIVSATEAEGMAGSDRHGD